MTRQIVYLAVVVAAAAAPPVAVAVAADAAAAVVAAAAAAQVAAAVAAAQVVGATLRMAALALVAVGIRDSRRCRVAQAHLRPVRTVCLCA